MNKSSDSINCIRGKIKLYKCDQDHEVTPLTLLSSFISNITNVCETNDTAISPYKEESSLLTVEWLKAVNSCLKDKR